MNNELFDSIIREQLAQQAVTPSPGVKKVLTKKLFFQNLWIFHKIKLVFTLIGASAVAVASIYVLSDTNSTTEFGKVAFKDESWFLNDEVLAPHQLTENSKETIANKNETTIIKENGEANYENNTSDDIYQNEGVEPVSNDPNYTTTTTTTNNAEAAGENKLNKSKSKSKNTNPALHELSTTSNDDQVNNESSKNETVEQHAENPLFENNFTSTITFQEALPALNQPVLSSVVLDTNVGEKVLLGKSKPYIYKELSFDVFSNVQNQGLITNEMTNEVYKTYYWDFYADQEERKMPTTFGAGINLAIGTYRHKLNISSGFNYTKMEETKTKYEFNEVTSQAWLDVFGVNEFSWINTYGKDTCTTCFYASATDELKNEIREEFNKYTYVNVPLQLGYTLNLGMVSLGLKGGIQTSILGNAKGLYSKKSFIEEGEQLYFWKGLEMTTLSRENDMLKPVYFSYMIGGEVKLRLTSKIDAMLGYNYIKSAGNLTKDDYLYSKKYTNQSLQVGLSFYPNRLPILRKLIF